MPTTWKLAAACSMAVLFLLVAGCGSGGSATDQTPPGTEQSGSKADAGQTPSGTASTDSSGSPDSPDPQHPVVLIQTSLGDITVTLDREKALFAVDNFLGYIEAGHYDQTLFHQVFPGAVILGGLFTPELQPKPCGLPIRHEAPNGLKNVRGTIAMYRDSAIVDSATCQFFINVKDNPNYDYRGDSADKCGYCVFGKVTDGMDVVDRIATVEVHDTEEFERTPVDPVVIESIRQIR